MQSTVSARGTAQQRKATYQRWQKMRRAVLSAAVAGVAVTSYAGAATVYWDRNSNGDGATNGTTASGTWDAASTNWTTTIDGSALTVDYATANAGSPETADVVFSAGSDATGQSLVTLAAATLARSVQIEEGGLSLSASTLTLGSGGFVVGAGTTLGSTIASTLVLGASQTWQSASGQNFNVRGAISAAAAGTTLTVGASGLGTINLSGGISNGTGVLTLDIDTDQRVIVGVTSTSNSYTGGTILRSGVLSITNSTVTASPLGTAGTISFLGGTLQYGNGTSAGYDLSSRFSSADGQNYRIDTNGSNANFASGFGGNTTLTKLGAGTLTLAGSNSFTTGIDLNGGRLQLNHATAIGTTGTISFNGGTLQSGTNNNADYSARFSTAAGQAITLDPNGRTVTIAAAGTLNNSGGSFSAVGSTAGTLALNASLGSGITSLNLTSTGTSNMTLEVNGTANAYAGGTNVLGGVLAVNAVSTLGANLAGNTIKVSNHGILQLGAVTNVGSNQTVTLTALDAQRNPSFANGAIPVLDLRYNGALPSYVASGPLIIGYSGGSFTAPITLGAGEYLGSRATSTLAAASLSLSAGAGNTYRLGGGGSTLIVEVDNAITGNSDLVVGVTPFLTRATPTNGGGTVQLKGSQDYTGSTLINFGSTLAMGQRAGGPGRIISTSGIIIRGGLTIDNNSGSASADRLGDSTPITLDGGSMEMTAPQIDGLVENVGPITLGGYHSVITMNSGTTGKPTDMTADSIARTNSATLLVRGGNILGTTATVGAGHLRLDDTSGLNLVGLTNAAGVTPNTSLRIVPWIIASNTTNNGSTFATYDFGADGAPGGTGADADTGFRPLAAMEYVALDGVITNTQNVVHNFASGNGSVGGVTVNSIALTSSGNATIAGSGGLSSSSGALAYLPGSSSRSLILNAFDSFTIGSAANPEAVVIVSEGALSLNSSLNNGTNWALTKSGGGTLNLGAANTFAGAVRVVQGTLRLNNAGAVASSSSITVNSGASLEIGNTGTGTVTYASGPLNMLDGSQFYAAHGNTYSMNLGSVINLSGTVRFKHDAAGTGSRTQTVVSGVSMANDSTLAVTLGNNDNELAFNPVSGNAITLNGTGRIDLMVVATGERLGLGIIGENVAESDLVLNNNSLTLGSINLNRINTYTGTTFVESGWARVGSAGRLGSGDVEVASGALLQLDNGLAIDDSAELSVASGGTMHLNFAGVENIATLVLGGVSYTEGLFNSLNTPDYFTGTGSIAVPEPGTLSLAGLAGVTLLKRRRRAR